MKLRRIMSVLLATMMTILLPSCTVSRIGGESDTSSQAKKLDYTPFDYEDFSSYVTLGQYKGIEYVYGDLTVTETEINDLKEYYMYNGGFSELVAVSDRAVVENDNVTIEYVCYVDEEEYASSDETQFYVGYSDFLEGFDEELLNMNIGETKVFTLQFSDDYDESLAGKDAEFHVKLKNIEETVFDELTDEVAQTLMSDTQATVESFMEKVEQELFDEKYANAEYNMRVDVWTEVYNNAEVIETPEREYQSCYDDAMASYEYQMQEKYGMSLSEFCTQYAVEEAYYTNLAVANARQFVSEQLITYAIAKDEGITINSEETNQFAEDNFETNGYESAEEFLNVNEFYVICMTMQEKVIDFLVENAIKATEE